MSGQIIIKDNSNEDICLRNFKRGFYIITAVTKDNKRITKKNKDMNKRIITIDKNQAHPIFGVMQTGDCLKL